MGKSYRFDPSDEFGGENLPKVSKKQLKAMRKARRKDEIVLEEQMQPVEDDNKAW